jgi:hypothetical protein
MDLEPKTVVEMDEAVRILTERASKVNGSQDLGARI